MSAGKIVAIIAAVILILFGALMVLAGTNTQPYTIGMMLFGILFIVVGLVIIYFSTRQAAKAADNNVTLKIDLPGNVAMDTLKCKSCGGTLEPKDIQMVAGAPVVTCPYCHTTYQLTEEPKW
jgi:Na+/melibiose symporter-like transporter